MAQQQRRPIFSSLGLLCLAAAAMPALPLLGAQPAAGEERLPPPTIADAIKMVRIQYRSAIDGSVAAISPDGHRAVAVVWRGDLARNTNLYSLIAFKVPKQPGKVAAPEVILTWPFAGDPADQHATPFSSLTFLDDDRTVAFIGRQAGKAAQVYTVDVLSSELRQLTEHPTSVRSFAMGPQGALLAYSAVANPGAADRQRKLEEDGVFLWDRELFPSNSSWSSAVPILAGDSASQVRQYFLPGSNGLVQVFDSRLSRLVEAVDLSDPGVAVAPRATLEDEVALRGWATLTADPHGKRVLLFPYALSEHPMQPEQYHYYATRNAYARRVAAPYGVIDVESGRIERLLDAPHPQFGSATGPPLWAPDGRSVIVYTLLPDSPAEPPQWVEVAISSGEVTPLPIPFGWRPVSWTDDENALLLRQRERLGILPKTGEGRYGELDEKEALSGFNPAWKVATNGRVAIGVKDAVDVPPELVVNDLRSQRMDTVSNFNPELHNRRYGATELFHWESEYDRDNSGFLVKPPGFEVGKRYPLVVLLDNGTLGREGEPFLLDGVRQLSGHAVQMLAADGFIVFYPRGPRLGDDVESPCEGIRIREHIESAIEEFHRRGLINPERIGISGWSRSGYYTHYLLVHSDVDFAAATVIDGGGIEYTDGLRPFTDDELRRIRTPLLFEAHGPATLAMYAAMVDRLKAARTPTEILYFHRASHATIRPQHRFRSLSVHVDWWRFWLQGKEGDRAGEARPERLRRWQMLRSLSRERSLSGTGTAGTCGGRDS